MARADQTINVPVRLDVERLVPGFIHAVACMVYSIKTGSPLDFRGKDVPEFIRLALDKDPEALKEYINGT